MANDDGVVTTFASGATRSSSIDKIDPEAFIDPAVELEFCEYMQRHRFQPDGNVREGDNWQKGFTRSSIIKSMQRHLLDLRLMHRGHPPKSEDCRHLYDVYGKDRAMKEALCAIHFGADAYIREILLERNLGE